MPRTGRRAGGGGDTRRDILAAAREAFARDGYRATIRGIAANAGVDPALVLHYFESKDKLYVASIHMPVDPSAVVAALRGGPHDELGRRLATLFFTVWEQPDLREPILAILRGAASGHDPGTAAFREFVLATLMPVVAAEVTDGDPRLRAELAVAHLVGIAIMRYVLELEPMASASLDTLVDLVAPRIQSYFDPTIDDA